MARETLILEVRGRGFRRVEGQMRRVQRTASSLNRTLGFLRSALVVFASIRILQGFIDLADSLTLIRNRIRTVTRDIQTLNAVQNRLFQLSQRTRTSFEGNATVFARFARAVGGLNLTYEELLNITEGVNQAVQISGSTAQEARNALIQFAQGLSSGALQGEELRSVSEQIPRLAEAIGREFGIAAGELIAFNRANPGVFITERVVKALRNELPRLNDEFKAINVTIAQAFERLNNSLIVFVGNTNSAVGVTRLISSGLTNLANNLDKVVLILGTIAATVAFNILVDQLTRLRRTILLLITLALSPLLKIFRLIRTVLLGIGAIIGIVFAIPLIASLLPILVAVGAVWVIWRNEISKTIDEIDKAGGVLQILEDVTRSVITAIVTLWNFFSQDFEFIWDRLVRIAEAAMRSINRVVIQNLLDIFSAFRETDIGDFLGVEKIIKNLRGQLLRAGESVGDVAAELGERLQKRWLEAVTSDPTGELTKLFRDVVDFFSKLTSGAGGLGDLNKKIPVFGAESNINKFQKELEKLLGSVSKSTKLFIDTSKAADVLAGSMEAGAISGEDAALVMTRLLRSASGVGNAVGDFADQQEILNSVLALGAINAEEYDNQLRKIRITFLESQRDFSSGVSLFFNKYIEDATNTAKNVEAILSQTFQSLEDQLVQLAKTGEFSFRAIAQAASDALIRKGVQQSLGALADAFNLGGTETPEELAAKKMVEAFREGGDIAADKIKRALAGGSITAAKEQRDLFGLADNELKVSQDSINAIDNTLKEGFDFSLSGLFSGLGSIFDGLISGLGGILGSVVGAFSGGGSGSTGADIGNILASVGTKFAAFAGGGSFGVDSSNSLATIPGGGVDNRLIAFRANDREQVTVGPKGGGAPPVNLSMTVVTPDSDSFRRNQGQILNDGFNTAQQAARRFS